MKQLPYLYMKYLIYNRPTESEYKVVNEIYMLTYPNISFIDKFTSYKEIYIPLDSTTYFTISSHKFQIANTRIDLWDYFYFCIADIRLLIPKWIPKWKYSIFTRIVNQITINMKLCHKIQTIDEIEQYYNFPFHSEKYKQKVLTYLESNDKLSKDQANSLHR